jgi:hypothetical protein
VVCFDQRLGQPGTNGPLGICGHQNPQGSCSYAAHAPSVGCFRPDTVDTVTSCLLMSVQLTPARLLLLQAIMAYLSWYPDGSKALATRANAIK